MKETTLCNKRYQCHGHRNSQWRNKLTGKKTASGGKGFEASIDPHFLAHATTY